MSPHNKDTIARLVVKEVRDLKVEIGILTVLIKILGSFVMDIMKIKALMS